MVGYSSPGSLSLNVVTVCGCLGVAQAAGVDLCLATQYSEYVRRNKRLGEKLISLASIAKTLGSFTALFVAGPLSTDHGVYILYKIAAPLSALMLIPIYFGVLRDPKISAIQTLNARAGFGDDSQLWMLSLVILWVLLILILQGVLARDVSLLLSVCLYTSVDLKVCRPVGLSYFVSVSCLY